jgi:hypothetical protein
LPLEAGFKGDFFAVLLVLVFRTAML